MADGNGRAVSEQAIRDAAKWLLRRGGIASSGFRPMPDLLIVGAKRGGTTSLWRYLQEHPSVLSNFPRPEKIKGTYFLSEQYGRGTRWYRSHFPSSVTRWWSERQHGVRPIAIDASPYDLYHPLAPTRAAQLMPGVFVVALLRDPVERTFSHWKERTVHTETLSFEDALAAEADRCRGEEERLVAEPGTISFAHRHQSYVGQSEYLPMLERWHAHFPPEQVLVWISEEFYADPQAHVDELTARLGLPQRRLLHPEPYNAVAAPDMRDDTRRALEEHFRPQVEALAQQLGRELPWLEVMGRR
jgi:hypothetical protein